MGLIENRIRKESEYRELLETAKKQFKSESPLPMLATGLCEGAKNALYSALIQDMKAAFGTGSLVLLPDEKDCVRLCAALRETGLSVYYYPYRDLIFHDITSSHEYEHERLAVLHAAACGEFDAVVSCPDAALQFTVPSARLEERTFEINSEKEYDPGKIAERLTSCGYVRVDMVDGKGQFSVRGGILDVFPPSMEYPVRMEFFDREIDQMGIFDTFTQRKIERIDSFLVTPAREIFCDAPTRDLLSKYISEHAAHCDDASVKDTLESQSEAVRNSADLNFLDKYISFIYPEKQCLLDYFPGNILTLFEDINTMRDRVSACGRTYLRYTEEAFETSGISAEYCVYGKAPEAFEEFIKSRVCLETETFFGASISDRQAGIFNFRTRQTVNYGGDLKLLSEDIAGYRGAHDTIVLLTENDTSSKTLSNMLDDMGIPAVLLDPRCDDIPEEGMCAICHGLNLPGFELIGSSFVCLSLCESPLSRAAQNRKTRREGRRKSSSRERIMSYADLNPGDYVVHANYGIGKYVCLKTMTVNGITKDFIQIAYAGKDTLYLQCNQLELLSKYIGPGAEDGTLKLSKMGGGEWTRARSKVKASAKLMAKELIDLYARRLREKGFAFRKDEQIERDFAASFEYEETEGQATAISEILSDMEKEYPMDRLLCGDVGFGKTEVSLRAAFKAVCNQKQVAVLVPTTILAMQHYHTFISRMRSFPVNIDMISRFKSAAQQKESVRRLARGETDILIGTHRLISKDVIFKDLGLVIIDEEQRFGVAQKEKLKQLTTGVDVLSLTATPIPRTLSMSMSGIRDMSVLEEAPSDRMPVQTYVLEYDEAVLSDAIRKELRRGGQVFFLCNSIERMDDALARVRRIAPPDARIAFAHGRLDKDDLSEVWRGLVDGEIDILVSTTIIETGIDVPNANTLIIENADRFGLSQLHQIRGRIGRSSRRAYAYFTYPKGKALSEIAEKRLSSIRDYTEFGSGFKIALRDLEIRGAGNILGAEQHGHIASVGYDMYMRLLNEAILEEKGETLKQKAECSVDINCNAYIPEKYISGAAQRIDAYKKISLIGDEADMRDVYDELQDRYGSLPPAVENLLGVAVIRSFFSDMNVSKIKQTGNTVFFYPEDGYMGPLAEFFGSVGEKTVRQGTGNLCIGVKIGRGETPISKLKRLISGVLKSPGKEI